MITTNQLRLPAIEIKQNADKTLYSFGIDGKLISAFASVSRIKREDGKGLTGYQRPEILTHIAEIRNYIESESPMIPNSVVIAFDNRVKFEPESRKNTGSSYVNQGALIIPINSAWKPEDKPGFIVDGQQRVAAVRDATVKSFPLSATAFITSDLKEQTEQFILVNSAKPLPKGLIYELLPNTEGTLSIALQKRRFSAYLLERLNHNDESPLKGLIRTPTQPNGLIKDNSILRMIENSLSDGVLYRFRYEDGTGNVDNIIAVLSNFWSAVSKVFKDAWNKPPRESRLLHGAGIIGMGYLMDAISERHKTVIIPTEEDFINDLTPLKEICNWTNGYWNFGLGSQRKWNEVQNTTKDIQLLANYLLIQYKTLVWNRDYY